MEPGSQPHPITDAPATNDADAGADLADPANNSASPIFEGSSPDALESSGLGWAFVGRGGMRAGWSILIFAAVFYFFRILIGTVLYLFGLVGEKREISAAIILLGEAAALLALIGTAALVGLLEGRRIPDYNLADRRLTQHLFSGLVCGFAALSLLVGALVMGGWLRFGPAALSGSQALRFALLWGCAFLAVGAVEEGLFRCYGFFTLTRGIDFWWALVAETALCTYLFLNGGGNGAFGVYAAAAVGLIPCLVVHFRSHARSSFWQAAWVTSTAFALYHTGNNGENWVGIFAAAFIGFVFCVSVRVTGSAWWAIGCHAGWDWAETYFYGTADSGMVAQGHYLSATPAGNALWSGGSDGPEGSLLVLAVILTLLVALLVVYSRRGRGLSSAPATPTAS